MQQPLLFLPAAGFRYYDDGIVYSVGTDGYYWSSTVNSGYAYYLYFYGSNVSANNVSFRAAGFSVRCISEL